MGEETRISGRLVSQQETCDSRAECWFLMIINKSNAEDGRKCDLPLAQFANSIPDKKISPFKGPSFPTPFI